MASLMEEEIARLKLDLPGSCKVIRNQGSYRFIVNLKLGGSNSLRVRFALPDSYPGTIPDITVRNEFETSAENVEALSNLQENLITSAEKMRGSPMLIQLANQVSSWLEKEPRTFFTKSADEQGVNQQEGPSTGRVKVSSSSDSDEDSKLPPLRTAADVVSRILWDKQLNPACVTVGYLDRFTGLTEAKFTEFCWDQPISAVDNDTLAIPRHRIQYFKYKDVKIWDKNERLDLVFGSTGSEVRFHDLVKEMGDSEPAKADDQERDRWAIEGLDDDVDIDYGSIIEGMKEFKNVNRPNFFFGIRITDQDIRAKAESITEKIITSDSRLNACALSSTCFHITLATLRLDGEPQIRNAIHLLKNLQPAIQDQFPEPIVLTLDKLDHFYGNVLYAKVQHNPELMRFAEFIRAGIQSGGLRIVDIHSFSPHMTIMKINRPTQRQYGLPRTIDSFLYQPFKNEYFGKQTVSDLFLCPIAADRQDDGFYQTVMEMNV